MNKANPFLLNNRLAAFTASVMGNPEYHKSTKSIVQASDERKKGIEHMNAFHAADHEKRTLKQIKPWATEGEEHA